MKVVLEINAPGKRGQRIWLRADQEVRVGRTEWADFVIPEDSSLADIHFRLSCLRHECWIADLSRARGTFVNGVRVVERLLQNGDEIVAGQSRFQVAIAAPERLGSGELQLMGPSPVLWTMARTPAGMSVLRSQPEAPRPGVMAQMLSSQNPAYVLVNSRHIRSESRQSVHGDDLLSGLPDAVRAHHGLELVPSASLPDLDEFLTSVWGQDSVTLVTSRLAPEALVTRLRQVAASYLSSGLLRHQLLAAPPAFVRELQVGLETILVESEDGFGWVAFVDPSVPAHFLAGLVPPSEHSRTMWFHPGQSV